MIILLIFNLGPVIMSQIENEYGDYLNSDPHKKCNYFRLKFDQFLLRGDFISRISLIVVKLTFMLKKFASLFDE